MEGEDDLDWDLGNDEDLDAILGMDAVTDSASPGKNQKSTEKNVSASEAGDVEVAEMRIPILGDLGEEGEADKDENDDVEALQRMLVRMQAVRGSLISSSLEP